MPQATEVPDLSAETAHIHSLRWRREDGASVATAVVSWYAARGARGSGERGEVVLWRDRFTNSFAPQVGVAAVRLLEDAGRRPVVPRTAVCCGLTWISTDRLGIAERVLRRTLRVLASKPRVGDLVLGLEPSCTAVFRSDASELFPATPTPHGCAARR